MNWLITKFRFLTRGGLSFEIHPLSPSRLEIKPDARQRDATRQVEEMMRQARALEAEARGMHPPVKRRPRPE